jgi:hypothetical protein
MDEGTKGARMAREDTVQEVPVDAPPPPTYGQSYKELEIEQDGLNTIARIAGMIALTPLN